MMNWWTRRYVERLAEALGVGAAAGLEPEAISKKLAKWRSEGMSDRGSNQYLSAVRQFTRWLERTGRAPENRLAKMRPVSTRREKPHDRRPFTVDEFKKLMAHLDDLHARGGRYKGQKAGWRARDRKMVYWPAAMSALRMSELAALKVGDFDLDGDPPSVSLKPHLTKNGGGADVPLPAALVEALRGYFEGSEGAAFPFPSSGTNVLKMFKRDLLEAAIRRKAGAGVLDFHSLRHTAITWWLMENQMHPREVQYYARLSSLSLVDRYSRGLRLRSVSWLERSPEVVRG